MQARIDAHKEKKVGWVDELTSADVLDTINRVFPAGTRQHLDLSEYAWSLLTDWSSEPLQSKQRPIGQQRIVGCIKGTRRFSKRMSPET